MKQSFSVLIKHVNKLTLRNGLFFFAASFSATCHADESFKFIVGADPQPWRLDSGDPNSSSNRGPWKAATEPTYQSMRPLGATFAIINGDMTEYGRNDTWSDTESAFAKAGIPVLFGLGNHDYANNVHDCTDGHNSWKDNCAITSLTNLFQRYEYPNMPSNYGGVSGLNVVNRDISYTVSNSDWKYVVKGSLAYSFEYRDIHFVQLNLCPTYEVKLENANYEVAITKSIDWAKKDVASAKNRGKRIILNYHIYSDGNDEPSHCWLDNSGIQLENQADAVFTGHTHTTSFNDLRFGGAPHLTAGAIFHGDYFLVETGKSGMMITAYNGKSGTPVKSVSHSVSWRGKFSLNQPVNGQGYADTLPKVSGTGVFAGDKITVSVDGKPFCSTIVDSDMSWSCATTELPRITGSHSVTAFETTKGVDTSPAKSEYEFSHTESPGLFMLKSPINGQPYENVLPKVSGTGIFHGDQVNVSYDDRTFCTATVDINRNWTCDMELPRFTGSHSVTASTMLNGQETTPQRSVYIYRQTDLTGNFELASPADGGNYRIPGPTPKIYGIGTPGASVTISYDGGQFCLTTVNQDTSWACSYPVPTEVGTHSISASEKLFSHDSPVKTSTYHVTPIH
jgi:hypothetical protein